MEVIIRLSAFVGILCLMMLWEVYAPRRKQRYSRLQRWPTNFSISIIGMIIVRFTVGGIAYVSALYAMDNQIGLLNQFLIPDWFSIVITLLLLDLAIYGQHRASHRWLWLWRFHKVHHSDLDFDVTTGIRFHPIEIIISMCYKVIIIYIIGCNPLAVVVFEVILSGASLFNHSNIFIPLKLERSIRLWIVTPDMHRVHHSSKELEIDSNFGFSISIWDRLFSSYIDQPQLGHDKMIIGLNSYRHSPDVSIKKLLLMPFKSLK